VCTFCNGEKVSLSLSLSPGTLDQALDSLRACMSRRKESHFSGEAAPSLCQSDLELSSSLLGEVRS
jgi:hypothetical protein